MTATLLSLSTKDPASSSEAAPNGSQIHELGFYKVPVDRRFNDKIWAKHQLTGKSVSRIVTEALAAHFGMDPGPLVADDHWRPRRPRSNGALSEEPLNGTHG